MWPVPIAVVMFSSTGLNCWCEGSYYQHRHSQTHLGYLSASLLVTGLGCRLCRWAVFSSLERIQTTLDGSDVNRGHSDASGD